MSNPENIVVDYAQLANAIMPSLKNDILQQILNDPIAARAGVISPDGGSADKAVKNFPDFLAAVMRNDSKRLSEVYATKAQVESNGTLGGYLVPPEFANMIDGYAIEEAIIRGGATVIRTSNPEYKAPRYDQTVAPDGSSAFLAGVKLFWTAEAGNITQTQMKFEMIDLKVNKLGAYVQVTSELLSDAPALSSMLSRQFGQAKAWFEDYNFINGNGVGKPLGILNAPATYSVTRQTSSDFTLLDAKNMIARLPAAAMGRAVFVMHQSVMPKLYSMAETGNFVTFLRDLQGRPSTQLLGHTVLFTEKVPALGTAGDVLLIDRSAYYLLDRQDTTISTSDAPAFLTDMMTLRMTARLDGQPALKDKIILADGAYQVSPFIKLS